MNFLLDYAVLASVGIGVMLFTTFKRIKKQRVSDGPLLAVFLFLVTTYFLTLALE